MAAEARVLDHLALDVGTAADVRRRPKLLSVRPLLAPEPPSVLELGSLPARGLGGLPAAFTARMRAVDGSVFHLSTSAAERSALAEAGAIALDAEEWEALTIAAEADRAWPADLVQALRARGVTGRLTLDVLLDGVTYESATAEGERAFSVARVVSRIGARVDAVWTEREGAAAFP
jgi:hypothetical protein